MLMQSLPILASGTCLALTIFVLLRNGRAARRCIALASLALVASSFFSCGGSGSAGGGGGGGGGGGNGGSVLVQFDGDTGTGSPTYKDHPDMAVAVSATQVLEVTGQDVNVYDHSGAMLKSTSMNRFITNAGLAVGAVNDPRVVYDNFVDRFIVVCSCSADYVMVSGSGDATGSWSGAALSSSTGDLTMEPGFDKNGLYVSEFQPTTLFYKVFAIPAADIASVSLAHLNTFTDRNFELMPAIDRTATKAASDPEYFIARSGPPQNGTNVAFDLLVNSLTWSGNKATMSSTTTISSGFLYNTPVDVSQPGAPQIRAAESHRIFGVAQFGTHLYAVEASGPCDSSCGSQGSDAHNLFFWFDVNTSNLTLQQSKKVSSSSLSFLFPSMDVDGSGNVGFSATGVDSAQNASVYLFSHRTTDAANVVNGPTLATAGTVPNYNCNAANPVGWGTYSNTVIDPNQSNVLWTVNEYAGSATNCVWTTKLIQFQL
jgi:hypothetical protein